MKKDRPEVSMTMIKIPGATNIADGIRRSLNLILPIYHEQQETRGQFVNVGRSTFLLLGEQSPFSESGSPTTPQLLSLNYL